MKTTTQNDGQQATQSGLSVTVGSAARDAAKEFCVYTRQEDGTEERLAQIIQRAIDTEIKDPQDDARGALNLVADLRVALGDTDGHLMWDELVDRAHAIVAALKDANDQCRTAYHIAQRRGQDTNWDGYDKQLFASLERQHKAMYPSNCNGYRGYAPNTEAREPGTR